MLSIAQADTINKLYKDYNDSIKSLNNTITIKNKKYDSIYKEIHRKQDSINLWQGKYQTSIDLFRTRPKARSYETEEKLDFAQKIILIAIILIQFQSLK
jgi:ribonuclease HIII